MIEIYFINDDNFKLDFTKDRALEAQKREILQQIYAFLIGWA